MGAIRILAIAVFQGGVLWFLHHALDAKAWPATDGHWLLGLYAVAIFVPTALEIMANRLQSRATWLLAAAMALVAGALGAYAGWVTDVPSSERFRFEVLVGIYGALFGAWFIVLPFAQAWARRGTWRVAYPDLFELSWQNALLLLEAAVFTGVFWLLLLLWAQLFKVLDINFFAELFERPAFAYPASAVVFGYAIHLIESHERIVITLRRHLLGVFSWLLPLVALVAVLFMAALPFTGLEPLWRTGRATFLMLCLQFTFIHFINSAYEDGQTEPRYPGSLKLVLRLAVLTLPIYAALCAYSLGLRVEQYGWTVSRVWAAIATAIATVYAIGYAAAALRRGAWMCAIPRVNIGMAAVVAALLVAATSPILDPRRLSAESQAARLRSGSVTAVKFDYDYLRFQLGRYGNDLLAELAKGRDDAAARASATLAKPHRYADARTAPPEDVASRIELHPGGVALDPAFLAYLKKDMGERPWENPSCLIREHQERCVMLALDLNEDGRPEFILVSGYVRWVYAEEKGHWRRVGVLSSAGSHRHALEPSVRAGRISTTPSLWRDVVIGRERYTIQRRH
jgi:hypothetical protein